MPDQVAGGKMMGVKGVGVGDRKQFILKWPFEKGRTQSELECLLES